MKYISSNYNADPTLDTIVFFDCLTKNLSKVVLKKNNPEPKIYKLDDYFVSLLSLTVHPDDFDRHAYICINLFKEEVKQHIKLKNDKLIYFISVVDTKTNKLGIPFISTDFPLCRAKIEMCNEEGNEYYRHTLNSFDNLKIYRYDSKNKEIGLFLGDDKEN